MEKITIEGVAGSSQIIIGNVFHQVVDLITANKVFIITDENVAGFYKPKFPSYPVYAVTPGEVSKELNALTPVFQWLLDNGADRNSFILGIGGGVVCDLAGFVASTFMRGIRFGFVATSLLAQVDASVGGKNGVNLGGYKNIIGTFTQPEFVICDSSMLKTLPEVEFANGLAEIIKHALIRDAHKFDFLEQQSGKILSKQSESIDYLVSRSVHIKAGIVQADEREHGERKLLNFGHTWGHAVEKVSGMPHGQAVSIGMVFASNLSEKLGLLDPGQKEKIIRILQKYNLPLSADLDKNAIFEAMLKDKKKHDQKIHFILLESIGKAVIREIDTHVLKDIVFN